MAGELLFRVVEGAKEYRIYSNGEIEGFAEGAIVINYFDCLLATAIQRREHPQPRDSHGSLSTDAAV